MGAMVEWSRLHSYWGVDGPSLGVPGELHAGWHLWGAMSHFPRVFGPGFRYLITTEDADGARTTNTLAVVSAHLRFTRVTSLGDAYAEGVARFGPQWGVGMSLGEWLSEPYNVERTDRRLFTAWTYHVRSVRAVDGVGDYNATFTGWKRLTRGKGER